MDLHSHYKLPADFRRWDKIDPLSPLEAAYLWEAWEPQDSTGPFTPPIVKARAENIAEELHLTDPWTLPGLTRSARKASRAQLIELAKRLGEAPAFLFPERRPGPRTAIVPPDGPIESDERDDQIAELERERDDWKRKAEDALAEVKTLSAGKEHYSPKLVRLIHAASKFWRNADRDERTTHPNNEDVVKWLMEEKDAGFSESLADKAATIIRPKWAGPGRKPEK